ACSRWLKGIHLFFKNAGWAHLQTLYLRYRSIFCSMGV
ncbi:hypothetical protein, partial [Bacillus altitudinis]